MDISITGRERRASTPPGKRAAAAKAQAAPSVPQKSPGRFGGDVGAPGHMTVVFPPFGSRSMLFLLGILFVLAFLGGISEVYGPIGCLAVVVVVGLLVLVFVH